MLFTLSLVMSFPPKIQVYTLNQGQTYLFTYSFSISFAVKMDQLHFFKYFFKYNLKLRKVQTLQ